MQALIDGYAARRAHCAPVRPVLSCAFQQNNVQSQPCVSACVCAPAGSLESRLVRLPMPKPHSRLSPKHRTYIDWALLLYDVGGILLAAVILFVGLAGIPLIAHTGAIKAVVRSRGSGEIGRCGVLWPPMLRCALRRSPPRHALPRQNHRRRRCRPAYAITHKPYDCVVLFSLVWVAQAHTRLAVVEEAAVSVASKVSEALTSAPYLAQSLSRLYSSGVMDLDSSGDYVPVTLLRGSAAETRALVCETRTSVSSVHCT